MDLMTFTPKKLKMPKLKIIMTNIVSYTHQTVLDNGNTENNKQLPNDYRSTSYTIYLMYIPELRKEIDPKDDSTRCYSRASEFKHFGVDDVFKRNR